MKNNDHSCRICRSAAFIIFEDIRPYFFCQRCGFIFSFCPLSEADSGKHYRSQYENSFDWHARAREIIAAARAAKGNTSPQKIFDFGSGSGKLAIALRTMGFDVDQYEPMIHGHFIREHYRSDYDLIILNEVIEHTENPLEILDQIHYATKPGGLIFISTLLTDDVIRDPAEFCSDFSKWWYKNDLTHVSFFVRSHSKTSVKCEKGINSKLYSCAITLSS